MNAQLAIRFNALGLYAISALLLGAFAAQILLNELPCPLCLLQRVAFAALAVGPILNLRYGLRPSHYGLSMLAALAGMTFSARQLLLHIMPGDPGYGSAILGYHYYTWAFICFAIALVLLAVMLLFDRAFETKGAPLPSWFEQAAVWLVIVVTLLNVGATLYECGFAACPDNPVSSKLGRG